MNTTPPVPTTWQVVLSGAGTPDARWVLQSEHEGVGVVAEGARAATTTEPDDQVAVWVADCLEVTGTVLAPGPQPGVWTVGITY